MPKPSYHHPLPVAQVVVRAVLIFIAFTSAVLNVRSSTSATDGATPSALQPGAPAGSYALSGLDNINLFNGNLNFRLPLAAIIGRGEIGSSVTIPFERKWRVLDVQLPQPDGSVNHLYMPVASFWKTLPALYNPGGVEGRRAGYDITTCPDNTTIYTLSLTRITFTTADGTEYELRDTLTNGQPASNGGCNYLNPQSRGTVFASADGTGATFISDQTLYDQVVAPGDIGEFRPSGYLMLSDGTRYRIDSGRITWARDRNGNKITYNYDGNNRVTAITDSLKRVLNITYASGSVTYDQISFKGYAGLNRTIRVNYASLSTVLQSGAPQTFRQLFPELLGGSQTTTFNPTVLASVTLPAERQYQFRYNVYGELTRVVLPTGGAYEYDYAGADSASGTTCCGVGGSPNIARRVVERRVYSDGGTGSSYETKVTYSIHTGTPATSSYVVVKTYKQGSANPIAQQKHYFYGLPLSSFANLPTDYSAWNEGKEYQTEFMTGDGATVLKREAHTFQNRAAVSWWPILVSNNTLEPPNDPRLTQTVTTLEPSGQNLQSKVAYGYDDSVPFNNRNNVKEYDFAPSTPGELLRETRTTYLTSSSYTGTNVHLRNLALQVSIYDGNGVERSRTTAEFDNYATDTNHAALTNCPNISGFDSAFNTSYLTRGNVTCSTRSILNSGVVTGSVTSCRQFDIAGNTVKTINARGFAVTTEYADRFGSPDGDARANAAPADLGGLTSYAFPTKIINSLGHTMYAQFDYYLSQPVDAEDTNGIVTSGYFEDALDRPTQVRRAVGTALQNQTTFAYNDETRLITTSRDQATNNDNLLVTKLLYDKLGRTEEERQYEDGSNYIAVRTQYDAHGRPFKTSKPFRPLQGESPVWITQAFDALGRIISVTYPDNAVVSTSYDANAITVTD
ncbi:MAG TPA: hypothetical protein VFY67_06970, partial [Pyrinomonadaceae bacterium]|nr:hypothetical protein [Pyrinomonadaceae bacterium]